MKEIHKKEFFDLIKLDFERIDLKADEIDQLNVYSSTKYQNIRNSDSYREFELLERINQLNSDNNNLKYQKQVYQKKIKEIKSSTSWKLTEPLRKLGIVLRKL